MISTLCFGKCGYMDSLKHVQVLIENIKEYAPIVYTPTVGRVCQNYSGLFRRPRGMYFSAADHGEMMSMVYNWPAEQVVYFLILWIEIGNNIWIFLDSNYSLLVFELLFLFAQLY